VTGSQAAGQIADFLLALDGSKITSTERHTARRALLDTMAVAIAGCSEPATKCVQDYARGQQAPLMASVWATGERLPLEMAALVNGVMGHVMDYDDVTSPMRGHPSIAMCPPLVAYAEATGASCEQLLVAYVAGFEIVGKLSRAVADKHYAKGWHSTATIGLLGAVAGLAHLMRLNRAEIGNALGLAVAQCGGTQENFGSMAKPFQAGQAGAAALRAALLAREGFDASHAALDGPRGFTALYADGHGHVLGEAFAALGKGPLEISSAGIEIKKYPMCYAAHRAIDGILDLQAAHPGLRLDRVARVEVRGSPRAFVPLIHDAPRTGLEGKFSMPYAVAAALADGDVRLASFEDAAVQRPEIQAFLSKVHKSQEDGELLPRWTKLTLFLEDGEQLERRVEALRGSAGVPLSDAELTRKVEDCCSFAAAKSRSREDDAGIDGTHLSRTVLSADAQSVADLLAQGLRGGASRCVS